MPVLPEVHDALARAVAAGPVRRTRRRPSRRAGLLGLGAVVVSGTALAATGSWHPILGDGERGHPQAAVLPVPAGQVAALGVLRRPQNDGDRGPESRAILRLLVRGETNGVHVDGVRVLARHHGGATVLVPAERVGRHDPGYPSTIRRQVLCLDVSHNLPTRTATISQRGRSRTVRAPGGFSAAEGCGDLEALRTTGIGVEIPVFGRPVAAPLPHDGGSAFGPARLSVLVPDGVAAVRVRMRGGQTVTARVHDNLYEIDLPGAGADLGAVWLDAQGHRIDHHER